MSSTAADVALQGLFDFGLSGMGILLEKSDAAHDHAGCAVGALEGFGIEEGLLDGMEAAGLFEAFNRNNGLACGRRHGREARATSGAIEQNGARATLAFAATVLGTSETEVIPKND